MQPEHVKYNEIEYDVIGIIDLNNGKFLILKNEENVIGLDMSNINSSFFNVSNIKKSTKVEVVLVEYILEAIRNDIKNGKYQNKEELKKDIVDLNKYINTHPELLNNMKQLDFKDDVVDKTITGLLSYFDEVMSSAPLNLEGITSFKVNGKDYIKYKDENGQVKIMDDNVDNRNFVEQFKAKQNESKYFKQEDGKESALNIAEDMNKYQKTSVELEEVEDIKEPNVDLPTKAMQKYDEGQDKDIVGNTETGVFYDENNDQILTAEKKDDKVIVSEVKEATHIEYNDGVTMTTEQPSRIEYPPYNEEVVTQYLVANKSNKINIDAFIDKYLYDFSVTQIEYLLNNYPLTQDQITKLNSQKSSKVTLEQSSMTKEKPKVLVKKKDDKAAFVDTLLLSFIVGLVSGMYLVFLILIIMS